MNIIAATNPGSIAPAPTARRAGGGARPHATRAAETLLAAFIALLRALLLPKGGTAAPATRLLFLRHVRAFLARTGAAWPRARITPAQRCQLRALRTPHTLPLPAPRRRPSGAAIRRAALRLRLLRRGQRPARAVFPLAHPAAAATPSPTPRPHAQALPPPKNAPLPPSLRRAHLMQRYNVP